MKKFYVRFAGDNDFHKTVNQFVKSIAEEILTSKEVIRKEVIVSLFNNHAYSLFVLYQNSLTENNNVKNYLKISEKDVYFDNEVDTFIIAGNMNNDGCAAEIKNGEIYFYYM